MARLDFQTGDGSRDGALAGRQDPTDSDFVDGPKWHWLSCDRQLSRTSLCGRSSERAHAVDVLRSSFEARGLVSASAGGRAANLSAILNASVAAEFVRDL